MNSLDDLSLIQVLNELRPSDIIKLGIVDKVHNLLTKDPLVRYALLKRWCPTNKTIEELITYVPNITLQQISVLADYYYPTKDSIGKYPLDELFYNACKAGYNVSDCLVYYIDDFNIPASAIVTKRRDILDYWKSKGIFKRLFNGLYGTNYIDLLMHRDMTIELWVDTIIQYGADISFLRLITGSSDLARPLLIALSNHPQIHRLAKHFGRTYIPPNMSMPRDDRYTVILKHKLGIPIQLLASNPMILSLYNSKQFPSYDLVDDICSGNLLEVMHKVNTVDRNILVESASRHRVRYVTYVGYDADSFPPLVSIYNNARLETVGQCTLYLNSNKAKEYLSMRGLHLV